MNPKVEGEPTGEEKAREKGEPLFERKGGHREKKKKYMGTLQMAF